MIKMKNVILLITLCFVSFLSSAQQNQNEWFANINSGKLTIYKPEGDKLVSSKKPWPFEVVKQGSKVEKVLLQRAGIIEEEFLPDLITHPAYFLFESQRIAGFENAIFYFTWRNENATIKYAMLPEGKSISGSVKDWEKKLASYQLAVLANQGGARENLAEAKKEIEAAEKIANSINNKNVKSIKVTWINLPNNIGHGTKLKYGIEAILEDGKVLKTNSLGGKMPWDDFAITVQGAEFGEEQVAVEMDAKKIPNDKVVITVKAKSNKSLYSSIETNLNYNENVSLEYNAFQNGGYIVRNSGVNGKNAKNYTVKAKNYTTPQGVKVNKVEVVETATGKVLSRLKMNGQATLNIYASGEGGSSGKGNKKGGNGGNGGDVAIKKEAGSTLNVNVVNNGGNGGTHSSPVMHGMSGRKGQVTTSTQSVQLSF